MLICTVRTIKHTVKIEVKRMFPVADVRVAALSDHTCTSVVKYEIDATVLTYNFSQYMLYFFFFGNIQLLREDAAFCPGDRRLCFGKVNIGTINDSAG